MVGLLGVGIGSNFVHVDGDIFSVGIFLLGVSIFDDDEKQDEESEGNHR